MANLRGTFPDNLIDWDLVSKVFAITTPIPTFIQFIPFWMALLVSVLTLSSVSDTDQQRSVISVIGAKDKSSPKPKGAVHRASPSKKPRVQRKRGRASSTQQSGLKSTGKFVVGAGNPRTSSSLLLNPRSLTRRDDMVGTERKFQTRMSYSRERFESAPSY